MFFRWRTRAWSTCCCTRARASWRACTSCCRACPRGCAPWPTPCPRTCASRAARSSPTPATTPTPSPSCRWDLYILGPLDRTDLSTHSTITYNAICESNPGRKRLRGDAFPGSPSGGEWEHTLTTAWRPSTLRPAWGQLRDRVHLEEDKRK